MIVELHVLQNFAPSCLNRDDTNSPKECLFGGYRRARVSSQCIKKSIRDSDVFKTVVNGKQGVRTKKLITKIGEIITSKQEGTEEVNKIIAEIFEESGFTSDKNLKTDVLIFIDEQAIKQIAQIIQAKLSDLRNGNKEQKKLIIEDMSKIVENLVKTPDISLFGRMLAVKPDSPLGKRSLNIDAACQVAHAISTHKVGVEFDFYTAIDDLQTEEEPGAGMMGTIEFNSACYYRYANIDLGQLKTNLGDNELARKTVEAFIRAAKDAVPSGKQTSFSAQNPPDFVMAVVRDNGSWSLANAFAKPVKENKENGDLVVDSIAALIEYWNTLNKAYPTDGISAKPALSLKEVTMDGLQKVNNFEELVAVVNKAIAGDC
ncbi:MAG: type I-E CRISPR-associated protein Cas7/Cse4/CasC [Dehalococcoidales bacterium]|nr:type I-E CRISPR-associated protein Cas7/Cse4/CasC [Dehalococcoidales bacterium]